MSVTGGVALRKEAKLTLFTVGPFRVIGADGQDLTPKGRKACGLLALLALAPNHRRPRAWLQDKLWSDRGPEQGAGSLRQALYEIRHAFGPMSDCLIADKTMVALDDRYVAIDHRHVAIEEASRRTRIGAPTPADEVELFEGLDIADPEFEDWLRDERQQFAPEEQGERSGAGRDQQHDEPMRGSARMQRLQLALEPVGQAASFQDQIIAYCLTDLVAKTISELGTIDVLDFRGGAAQSQPLVSEHALALQAGVAVDPAGTTWRMILADAAEKRVLWSTGSRQEGGKLDIGDPALLREMNQIVDAALSGFLTKPDAGAEQRIATLLCQRGIQHLFKLGRDNMALADQLFARAFEMEPRGIYLAWRAYLRTYLLAERLTNDRQVASDEALAFMHQALEMEPRNSFVAGFSAHVHSIVRRSYVAAYELAQRSIQLNRANPMGWACLGIAECHLGKATVGFEHTLIARELAGTTPLRFQVDGLACLAGSMADDVDRSIWLGEACHALAPTFKPPLRYLSALYLLRGEEQQSEEMIRRLRVLEPEFSYEMLREVSYPAASLRRSKLLERIPSRQV